MEVVQARMGNLTSEYDQAKDRLVNLEATASSLQVEVRSSGDVG